MKKEYISPFANINDTAITLQILAGSNEKTQEFGNNSTEEYVIEEEEGDITNCSKYRNGFYE